LNRQLRCTADPKRGPGASRAARLCNGEIEAGEHRPCLLGECASCVRQRDDAARSPQERHPELVLELPDRLGKRRLGDVKPLGGSAEVQLLADGDEVAKMPKLDRRA
ncbi:MAG: hypothetical protein QOD43_437, partial [Gaiellaceae bacterium]|nr:hypothetical protein [Gaiellaceae bacterium]